MKSQIPTASIEGVSLDKSLRYQGSERAERVFGNGSARRVIGAKPQPGAIVNATRADHDEAGEPEPIATATGL